ncbi:MAG: LytTR family DNA-binding domain-containing protein [Mucilaginibacter sp.]|uniref:LytR/AlgR family response regulator transcription factor n=1 Tax=Mucilaginibacter sp. TaxID=1882438 RepID=UPI0031AEAEA0
MISKKQEEPIRYHDVPFFLVLIPVVNALNYYLTYTNISFNTHTLITFLIDTVDGYAAWWCFRLVILYLDKKMPYASGPLKRITLQLILTSLTGLVVIIILTELANLIATQAPVPASFYRYDLFIFLIWFFVLNGIYIALYYYHAMRQLERLRIADKQVRTEGFTVKDGRQHLVLAFDSIAAFFADDDYTAVITTAEKRYLLDKSLDRIEQQLPPELFFRLNRQYIVQRSIVGGYTKIENGKLSVSISGSDYLPSSIQVSRTKAPDFKNWFEQV